MDLSNVPLSMVNTFTNSMTGQSLFENSWEANNLGLQKMKFSSAFFKVLQSKLEAALWQYYVLATTHEDENVVVNITSKKVETYVKYPIAHDLELPYVGKVTMVKTRTSLPFVTLFGVPFWIEDCQSADIMVPAWSCKTVTRADIAYFKMQTKKCKIVLVASHGSADTKEKNDKDMNADHAPAADDPQIAVTITVDMPTVTGNSEFELVPEWALKHRYCICDATLTSLVPLPDVTAKVSKEVTLQQQRAEKSARSQVEQFLKQRKEADASTAAKAKKGSKKGNTSVDALAETLFVDGLPDDPAEKVRALETMVKTSEKLDTIIELAKGKITMPTRLGITKMASEEARTSASGRAKAMQDALEAAKRAEQGGGEGEEQGNEKRSESSLGVGMNALRSHVEKKSGNPVKKTAKDKKAGTSDLSKLGKHLLK